jgi:hypothetical protein
MADDNFFSLNIDSPLPIVVAGVGLSTRTQLDLLPVVVTYYQDK